MALNLTTSKRDFFIEGGADRTIKFTVRDDNGLVNFSGAKLSAMVRSSPLSEVVDLELSTDNGKITLAQDFLSFTVKLGRLDTKPLRGKIKHYEIEMLDTSGDITRLFKGRMRFD